MIYQLHEAARVPFLVKGRYRKWCFFRGIWLFFVVLVLVLVLVVVLAFFHAFFRAKREWTVE